MAPRGALFQHLADLEQAASRERQLARQRLQQKRSGEILTTYMAFPLNAAKERMAEGMAIGDAVRSIRCWAEAMGPSCSAGCMATLSRTKHGSSTASGTHGSSAWSSPMESRCSWSGILISAPAGLCLRWAGSLR